MKQTETMIEETAKQKRKPLRILLSVLCGLLALILLVLAGARLYFRLPAWSYYRASEKAFVIPGLSDGFVPQGMDYDNRTDLFWITGYMDDGSASPVYFVNRTEGELKKTLYLATEDGEAYDGHAGGIAVNRDYVYVAGGGDCCMYVYSCDEMMTAEDGASVKAIGSLSTKYSDEEKVRVSAVGCDGRYLYAVEFYRDPNYSTPENHKYTTPSGERNQALALAYELVTEGGSFGVEETPAFAITLPDMVQGICFGDNTIYTSSSYGTAFSHVREYDIGLIPTPQTIQFMGISMPLYHLDATSLRADHKLPPMSEEIVVLEDTLYTMCESASNKYFFGKLTSAKWCYATDLQEMKK